MTHNQLICVLAGALLISATACTHTAGVQKSLSVDDILKSGTTLEGQLVEVRGFVRFGDDSQNLWSSEDAYSKVARRALPPDDPDWNHCISLFDTGKLRKLLSQKDGQNVIASGVVRRDPRADGAIAFETCSELGLSIRKIN